MIESSESDSDTLTQTAIWSGPYFEAGSIFPVRMINDTYGRLNFNKRYAWRAIPDSGVVYRPNHQSLLWPIIY